MPTGTVTLFNDISGSGYIVPDDGSPQLKVSYRSIAREGYKILFEGQRVKYEIAMTDKGLAAVKVEGREE